MKTQPTTQATEARLADTDITAAVERLLQLKKGIHPQLIEVACAEGIVELKGYTDSLLSRERAADVAKAVRGVRGVINDVSIRTADVPDSEMKRRVETALLQDPAVSDYNVRCHAHSGDLTVEGTLQSWGEVQLVLKVLGAVPGVRHLHNHLRVRGGELLNSDEEITTQIRELLAWDIRVKDPLVTIGTDHGVVQVAGTVGTAAERDQVIATAYQAGAVRVEADDLAVAYWALDKDLRRQKFAPKADEAVAEAVRDVLRFDPRVRLFAPSVHVRDGVVMLAGTVSNLKAKLAAEQDAGNVVGVWDVHNMLQVQMPEAEFSPDSTIHHQAKVGLAIDPYLGHYAFTMNVNHGRVQLYGTVASLFDQERAADVVAGINGVVELTNHIQVLATEDERIATAAVGGIAGLSALSSLERDKLLEQRIVSHYYWSAQLHDLPIEVSVRDCRVTLVGTVDTWLERRCAAADAYACGARDVNNHLRLPTAA